MTDRQEVKRLVKALREAMPQGGIEPHRLGAYREMAEELLKSDWLAEVRAEVWQETHDAYCDWGEDCPEHTNPHRQPAKESR